MAVSEQFERVAAIFEDALDRPPEERATFIAEACGHDAALRAEVESLLEHDTRAGAEFLASPVVVGRSEDHSPPEWALGLVGRQIGRYTIVRLVGHGGMGCVFEAQQERPARTIALKVVQPGFSTSSAVARFRLEPEVLGRLQHPNIAQVFEAGVHEDVTGAVPYFAMEFIADAQSLLDYAETRKLPTRRRLELFAKVCDAIHHGHQKGIIHRDIKPANILVGAGGEPKVIDFGVARASDADIIMTTQHTNVGDLIGTVHYMSPEQCEGNPAAIDTRSDIYSLGVVLYELLTGTAPYETSGTTIYRAIRVIKEEPPRPPSTAIAPDGRPIRHLRGDLDAILLKVLEKNPARRYASADDLARDIRLHLAGEAIEARPPGPWRRLLGWAGRRPLTSAVIGALVVFALVAGGTLASLEAVIWYYYQQPVALEVNSDRTVAELRSRRGDTIHPWTGGPRGRLVAKLVALNPDRPRERGHVLIGFDANCEEEDAGQLRLYDVHQRNLDVPVWSYRLEDTDLPDEVRAVGHTAEQFNAAQVWLHDVFPEPQPPRSFEIVCVFTHAVSSWDALCVFDANGELLYRIWHDGGIGDSYWMTGPGLLVLAAQNQELSAHARGCSNATPPGEMPVVFALRPQRGVIHTELLDTSGASPAGTLAWYNWLNMCPVPDVVWDWRLAPPPIGRDPAWTVEYGLRLRVDSGGGGQREGSISWSIDHNGDPVPDTIVAPRYRLLRNLYPHLPAPEEFGLQDTPPGQ